MRFCFEKVAACDERPPGLAAEQLDPDAPGVHPLRLTSVRLVPQPFDEVELALQRAAAVFHDLPARTEQRRDRKPEDRPQ